MGIVTDNDNTARAAGATHKHYKGGYYRKVCDATDESTGEAVVVYQSLHDDRYWVRSAALFNQPSRFRAL